MTESRSGSWPSEASVHREKAVEHLFLGELSRHLLMETGSGPEILKAEHDSYGYDVVLEVAAVVRHVQLKITHLDGRRAHVDVSSALATKPGGCVLWMFVDPMTYEIGPYYWLGGRPGQPLPDLGDRPVRHSKANAQGEKAVRPGLRRIPKGRFSRLELIDEVAEALFGPANDRRLRAHLASRPRQSTPLDQGWLDAVRMGCFAAIPRDLPFEAAAGLAHLIDGYELAFDAGLTKSPTLTGAAPHADETLQRAMQTGDWEGDALELWVALFMEHRRERLGETELSPGRTRLLNLLADRLRSRLADGI
ncbi:MAG TPA: hypothetical protein VIP08_09350 [Phenylobacterium sp.]